MTGHPKKNVEDPCNELKWKYEKDVKDQEDKFVEKR